MPPSIRMDINYLPVIVVVKISVRQQMSVMIVITRPILISARKQLAAQGG